MPRTAFGTVIKLIPLSLIVGLLLNWFNVNPQDLLRDMVGNINPIMQWSINALDAAAPFTLLGADRAADLGDPSIVAVAQTVKLTSSSFPKSSRG